MLKYFTYLSCIFLLSSGAARGQQLSSQRLSGDALRAYRLQQIQDAYREKMHLDGPVVSSGGKTGESESTLATNDSNEKVSTSDPESEVHAAINPTDTNNIVIGPIHFLDKVNGMTLPIYYTTNFGGTWNKSAFQPLPYQSGVSIVGGGDPIFAYDANGMLYMSWIDLYQFSLSSDTIQSAMYWAYSTNGGQSWQQPAQGYIGTGWEVESGFGVTATTGLNDKEWMAVDRSNSPYRNTLYVAWTYLGELQYGVMVRSKPPGADSMGLPVQVSPDSLIRVQYTSLGVDAKGGLHVTYLGSSDGLNFGIYHSYSADGGQTFTTERIADADIPGQSQDATSDLLYGVRAPGNYPCAHLSIDTSGTGNLYEVWCALGVEQDSGLGTQIYFSSSTDNGATWSTPSILNNDLDTDSNTPDHFYPSIAVNGKGKISVGWYDRREDPNDVIGRYYIGQSTDQGQTWTNAPVATQPMNFSKVFNVNGNFGIGEYTQVLTTPNYTIPVWTDGRDNTGKLEIYAAFLTGAAASVERVSSVSEGLQLSPNYPNPFGSTTNLSFTLETSAHAELYVTNITGQRVASIYNGMAEAGEHDFTFDGSELANGAYYLNLESDLGIVRQAMTILR